MKERGIIFSAPMVRAILDGRKTMTRRVVKSSVPLDGVGDPSLWNIRRANDRMPTWEEWGPKTGHALFYNYTTDVFALKCPYGAPGDRLWVRENFWNPPIITPRMLRDGADTWPDYVYCADPDGNDEQWKEWGWKKKPSIHMPRWASRITLEITGVRVERLNDISINDVLEEGTELGSRACYEYIDGIPVACYPEPDEAATLDNFIGIWESIHGAGSWERNDWVWVIEFRRLP